MGVLFGLWIIWFGTFYGGMAHKAWNCRALSNSPEIGPSDQSPSNEDRERAYIQKVIALYSEAMKAPNLFDTGLKEDQSSALMGKELELMMEFRLGKPLDPQMTNSILKQQADFLRQKSELDQALYGPDLGAQKYAKEGNELFGDVLRQVGEIMGEDQFKKVFSLSPPKDSFVLIDPEIAAKVHAPS